MTGLRHLNVAKMLAASTSQTHSRPRRLLFSSQPAKSHLVLHDHAQYVTTFSDVLTTRRSSRLRPFECCLMALEASLSSDWAEPEATADEELVGTERRVDRFFFWAAADDEASSFSCSSSSSMSSMSSSSSSSSSSCSSSVFASPSSTDATSSSSSSSSSSSMSSSASTDPSSFVAESSSFSSSSGVTSPDPRKAASPSTEPLSFASCSCLSAAS